MPNTLEILYLKKNVENFHRNNNMKLKLVQ